MTRPPIVAASERKADPIPPRDSQPDRREAGDPANPFIADHAPRRRTVRPIPPAVLARMLAEAGYDEPVAVPSSRLQTVIATGAVCLAGFAIVYFAIQFLRLAA